MKNYPALKCYTSKNQYDALVAIRNSKTIMGLIQDGRSSKTLGSLLRSLWIQEREFVDDEGIRRMGWFLTSEGNNAMVAYESVAEAKQKFEEERTHKIDLFMSKYPELHALRKEKALLESKVADVRIQEQHLISTMQSMLYGLGLTPNDVRQLVDMAARDMELKEKREQEK
jgi:hypothetical protein